MSSLCSKKLAARPRVPCACGCGELIRDRDRWNRPRRFVHGHSGKLAKKGRRSLKLLMTLTEARRIAGTLSHTTKMPGYSYGLDAWQCNVGSVLAGQPGSTCSDCYARGNFYRLPHVRESQQRRTASIEHPRWVDAMVELISHHCLDDPWFRWHDSGDLMGVEHLARIVEVCERTPQIRHWLPTREYGVVAAYLSGGGELPSNLTVRLSAHWVGKRAQVPRSLRGLPTSTVHEAGERIRFRRRRDSIECMAPTRKVTNGAAAIAGQTGACGSCRACWSPKVKNVSYPVHRPKGR